MTSDCAYLIRGLLDLVHPVLHSVKAFLVSDVIDDDDAVRAMVVVAGDRFEAFLTGCVPLVSQRFAGARTSR